MSRKGVYVISFRNTYITLALALLLAGVPLSLTAFLVLKSVPLTALGISTVFLGMVSFAVSRGQQKISPQAIDLLLQSGAENISALVEEIGLKSKAVYLPSSLTGDKPKALIPIDDNLDFSDKVLPKRLIVKYGSRPESMGLLVVTPGSAIKDMVAVKSDSSAGDLESALSTILVGTANLADGIRVTFNQDRVLVEIDNPVLKEKKMWVYESLGTPIASITASVAAEVLDKPVLIFSEQINRDKCLVALKVVRQGL